MGRWRPPTRPRSQYITLEGANRLRAELGTLWRIERPQVTQAVSEAAAQGDRSENADYIYGKRRLHEIDRRVRFLRKRLDGMVVVDQPPTDPQRIFFGAWVTVEDAKGEERLYRIVGPDEFDMDPNYISLDAPLGRALLGKTLDDDITLQLADGQKTLTITAIRYTTE